jgi:DNA-binding Lrp family transcriptional regulator
MIVAVIGVNGQLILFFWGLKTLGAIVITIGFIIALIITAAANWSMGKEDMSGFTLLYLFTMFIVMIIIGFISGNEPHHENIISIQSMTVTVSYGLAYGFFFITSGLDRMTNEEHFFTREVPRYALARTIFKITLIFAMASVTLIPLLFVLKTAGINPSLTEEISGFFSQLHLLFKISIMPNMLFITVFCTIIPFLGYYYAASRWPRNSSFELWGGITAMIEPIVNMLVGLYLLHESFPETWLYVVIVLMGIAILMKYLSETDSQVHSLIFITSRPNYSKMIMKEAYCIKSVKNVKLLLGKYDFMVEILSSSMKDFNDVVANKIARLPGLISYSVNNIVSISRNSSIPDAEKGMPANKRNKTTA